MYNTIQQQTAFVNNFEVIFLEKQQNKMGINTELLHRAVRREAEGSTLPPIYQTSAFTHATAEDLERVFHHQAPGFAYTRIGNPTAANLESRLAAIEGGIGAVACSSGMGAISMALLNILQAGDEIIASSCLFGGTIDLFGDLERLGIHTRFVVDMTPETVEPLINDRTKAIFTEVIGNPKLNVVDIQALADLAHAHGLPLLADSTTATPCLVRPIQLGADIVIHSTSKYISGSGNAISGAIIDSGRFRWTKERYPVLEKFLKYGPMAYLSRLRDDTWRNFGPCPSPMNMYLGVLGLETLGLRMERLCANAQKLAEALEKSPLYGDVNYPGLASSPWHSLAKAQLQADQYGAILTVRCGTKARAFSVINNLKYAVNATNIGDVRTLVIHPSSTIYCFNTEQEQHDAGVYDDLIRISVGLEDAEDLIADFLQAAESANGTFC
jgi:O-acetylhomoserine (thiol)-lyase